MIKTWLDFAIKNMIKLEAQPITKRPSQKCHLLREYNDAIPGKTWLGHLLSTI